MSTKVKKKTTKIKKPKRATLKLSYTEEEKIELKNKYDDILFHLSNFLSEHSVYEAVPENVKILVFSSELNFYEMIKVFIFEDIYCGLIYNPNLNNYLGLITTRDLMLLYKYIIDNFPEEKIENFDDYLKNIFSNNKINKEKNEADINNKEIINNINIFKHLKNINYLDYLLYVKNNKEFHNINLFSVSLDDNLFETLKKINLKNIHRLLVEDDIKKELRDMQKLKEKKKETEKMEIKRKEVFKNKRISSNTEKTTSANDSDEEKKNIKIDIKKIIETNKEDIIVEKSENNITKDEIENSREIINKEKNNENNEKEDNLNINKAEQKTEGEKPKKKKIIKKKIKSKSIQEEESIVKKEETQSPPPKKRISDNLQTDVKTICTETTTEIKEEETENKTVKKKVKKKIVKNKKEIDLELPEDIDNNKIQINEKAHHKRSTNITEFNYEPIVKIEDVNRANTIENEHKTEVKKKKIKKKIVKKKKKSIENKEQIIKDNIQENNKKEKEKEIINDSKEIKAKDTNENKEIDNNTKEKENNNNNLEQKIEKENEKDKKIEQRKESLNSLENIHFEDDMKNYVGIVTNETIFEYLAFNYYSNSMKEFNLSLNELIILGENTFLSPLTNIKDSQEKTYNTFNYHLIGNFDIIPIFSEKEIEGFIYPKDFFFFIYNCESDQNLTNNEFLEKLYKDIDDEKPYGKNRIAYLELNDTTKTFYVKELIENLDCSIEKKIVIYDPNDKNKLYLISLKTIFKAIVEFNSNK